MSSPALSTLGNGVHRIATRFCLIPTSVPHDVESGYSQLPGGARAEAERRRYAVTSRIHDVSDLGFSALALKALDQRLANSATNPSIQNGPLTSQSSRASLATPAPAPVDRTPSPGEMDVDVTAIASNEPPEGR